MKDDATILAKYIIMSRLQLVGMAVTPFYTKRDDETNAYQDMMQGFVATCKLYLNVSKALFPFLHETITNNT